jgi:hypothetical protein
MRRIRSSSTSCAGGGRDAWDESVQLWLWQCPMKRIRSSIISCVKGRRGAGDERVQLWFVTVPPEKDEKL